MGWLDLPNITREPEMNDADAGKAGKADTLKLIITKQPKP